MDLILKNNATEFRADSPFNIHIEGAGSVSLYKRTSGTGWGFVATLTGSVIDSDVPVIIPRDYKLTCSETPTMMVVTMGGESYEVEIPNEPNEPNVNLITFTISDYQGEDRTFTAEEGMTWREFCDSEYNTEGWEIYLDNNVFLYEGEGWGNPFFMVDDRDKELGGLAIADDVIRHDGNYITYQEGGIGGGGGSWG